MRQTIYLFFIGIVAIAIYTSSSVRIELNSLILENAEALASGESSDSRFCYDTWRKAPDDDSLAYWAWICSECEAYWLLEASNKSTC